MRLVLGVLLAIATVPGYAEWVMITEDEQATSYIDPTTIRNNGRYDQVWQLFDLKRPDEDGALSIRVQVEYDCQEEQFRLLYGSGHSGHLASGTTLWSGTFPHSPNQAPDPIPPGSAALSMRMRVCGRSLK